MAGFALATIMKALADPSISAREFAIVAAE